MTSQGLVFCIGLLLAALAAGVITHLVQCHTEQLRHTHFSEPMDYERYHYSRLPRFLDGDQK